MPTRSTSRGRLVTVLIAGVLLLAGSAIGSYAANGGPVLLGKSNKASKTTKIKTTGNGAALKLKSKSGKAPLQVSNSTKVVKLNADLVDGFDGAGLQTKSYVYELSANVNSTTVTFNLPGLPAGRYLVNYNVLVATPSAPAVGCWVGNTPNRRVPALGVTATNDLFYVTGAGLLDTALGATFTCFRSGAASNMTIPGNAGTFPVNQLVLTRVDDVATTPATGSRSSAAASLD